MKSNGEHLQDTKNKPFVRLLMAYEAPKDHDRLEIENPTLKSTFRIFSDEG